jgi:hypothetical protein
VILVALLLLAGFVFSFVIPLFIVLLIVFGPPLGLFTLLRRRFTNIPDGVAPLAVMVWFAFLACVVPKTADSNEAIHQGGHGPHEFEESESWPTPTTATSESVVLPRAIGELPGKKLCAENGSCYGDINEDGRPKTVFVKGYYRADGTHVQGYYRSSPKTQPPVERITPIEISRPPLIRAIP